MRKYKKLCPYCDPIPARSSHYLEKFEVLLDSLFQKVFKKTLRHKKIGAVLSLLENVFIHILIWFLRFVHVARFIPLTNKHRTLIRQRTWVVAEEAQKRGYKMYAFKFFNTFSEWFYITLGIKKRLFFYGLPLVDIFSSSPLNFNIDDKQELRKFLQTHNFSYTPGTSCTKTHEALTYAKNIGFPLVIKPRFGSLSRHTTAPIFTENELKEAIRIVRMIAHEFIIERYIEGSHYRLTVIGNHFIAGALREKPFVIGDGLHTIAELITRKNTLRKQQQKEAARPLATTPLVEKILEQRGMSLHTVIPQNYKLHLHHKIILSTGAEITNVTSDVHSEIIRAVENVSVLLKASIVGFDVISPNIRHRDSFYIIEANSVPYIDMHHYPTGGSAQNVAAALLDEVERSLES